MCSRKSSAARESSDREPTQIIVYVYLYCSQFLDIQAADAASNPSYLWLVNAEPQLIELLLKEEEVEDKTGAMVR